MRVIFSVLLVGLLGCSPGMREERSISEYYDLKGLMTEQIVLLTEHGASLKKIANFNSSNDQDFLYPDSLGWAREFNSVIEMDINKPVKSGRYHIDSLDALNSNLRIQHTYLKDSTDIGVTDMKVYYLNNLSQVRRIALNKQERNPIYHSSLSVEMRFRNEAGEVLLESYLIKGYQKMIFMDSSHYSIEGVVSL